MGFSCSTSSAALGDDQRFILVILMGVLWYPIVVLIKISIMTNKGGITASDQQLPRKPQSKSEGKFRECILKSW